MNERLKHAIETGATLASLGLLSQALFFALTVDARKEAGKRDKWTCQGIGGQPCYQASLNGGTPAQYKDGYMITLAHYPETHHQTGKGYHDPNPDNARCLCVLCHGLEEVDRGNNNGAAKMLGIGIFTRDEVRKGKGQVYLSVDEAVSLREFARAKQAQFDLSPREKRKMLSSCAKESNQKQKALVLNAEMKC